MSAVAISVSRERQLSEAFRHEALFYEGRREFVERTAAFIRDGIAAGEPVLVLVIAPKIELLRDELGSQAD